MKRIAEWSVLCAILALVGFGGTLLVGKGAQLAQLAAAARLEVPAPRPEIATLPESMASTVGTMSAAPAPAFMPAIQTAPNAQLSLVGTIRLRDERPVVLESSGQVNVVKIKVGDQVKADELLYALDTTDLDLAVEQAQRDFEAARIDFMKLGETSSITVAKANLLAAQEAQVKVDAGPTEEQLAAAESSAAAAWATYEDLQKDPMDDPARAGRIIEARANVKLAEIDLQHAQAEYDKIAWLPEAAASAEAANLQRATTALVAAKAISDTVGQPATEAALQAARAAAESAQDSLNDLEEKPTPAERAQANADVAAAETTLRQLEEGLEEGDRRKAELNVSQALSNLAQAQEARDNAQVKAPIGGTVMEASLRVGDLASEGMVAAVLADPTNIWLEVDVEQKDISRIQVGQPVTVSVFALPPDVSFVGTVERVAPIANSDTGAVVFPVTVNLTEGPLEQLKPGMTATAYFAPSEAQAKPTEVAPTEATPTEAAPTKSAPTEAAPTEAAPVEETPMPGATETPAA